MVTREGDTDLRGFDSFEGFGVLGNLSMGRLLCLSLSMLNAESERN